MRIFISGACQNGKTYLANQIAEHLNCPTFAYADKVKQAAALYNPHLAPEIYAETKTPKARQLCHTTAAYYQSRFGPNVFANLVHDQCLNHDSFVVSDLRFKEELALIKETFTKYVIIFIGSNVDEYDCREMFLNCDILLPSKPVKSHHDLVALINRIKILSI